MAHTTRRNIMLSAGLTLAVGIGACGSGASLSDEGFSVSSDSPGNYSLTTNAEETEDLTVYASTNARQPVEDGEDVGTLSSDSVTVDDLGGDSRWYFGVRDSDGNTVTSATRQVGLEGAKNVRDLGGYATEDGHTVKWGVAFRGDHLGALNEADAAKLETANISDVVDFRLEEEVADDGADRVTDETTVHQKPMLFPQVDENGDFLFTSMAEAIRSGDEQELEDLLGDGRAEEIAEQAFTRNLEDEEAMEQYAETLEMIADSDEDDAVLYHCTQGKDRTGMTSAMLLGLLGVPDEAIVDDFLLSNEFNQEYIEDTYEGLRQSDVDVDLVRPLMEQRESQIEQVLDTVHGGYGGWDEFGRDVLGLDDDTIEQLRQNLLT